MHVAQLDVRRPAIGQNVAEPLMMIVIALGLVTASILSFIKEKNSNREPEDICNEICWYLLPSNLVEP